MTNARALTVCFVIGVAACDRAVTTAPSIDGELLVAFDSVWQRFDNTYPYFEYKHIDWAAARTHYRPSAASAPTSDSLAAIVRQMVGELRDVHAAMITPAGHGLATYTPTAFVNWQRSVWDAYMQRADVVKLPTDWGYARMGSVPYVYFASWTTGRFTLADVDSLLEQFRDAPALIIDVRMNGGGNSDLAYGVAARFFDAPHITGSVQYRSGPSHTAFGDPISNRVQPRGPWQFHRPVLVLTGRGVFSSAEGFVMAMRVLPNVTVVGDTTGGGSGNPTSYLLPGGWRYNLPRWIERTPAGDVVEWRGLAPGIVIAASAADFDAGRDPVLDYAMQWAAGR